MISLLGLDVNESFVIDSRYDQIELAAEGALISGDFGHVFLNDFRTTALDPGYERSRLSAGKPKGVNTHAVLPKLWSLEADSLGRAALEMAITSSTSW